MPEKVQASSINPTENCKVVFWLASKWKSISYCEPLLSLSLSPVFTLNVFWPRPNLKQFQIANCRPLKAVKLHVVAVAPAY
ncbi:MAG: hypothetical protein L0Z53_15230 [Acidobacteriales bacterium]|nr:hypothetical protein [Terriglobales bacterium]